MYHINTGTWYGTYGIVARRVYKKIKYFIIVINMFLLKMKNVINVPYSSHGVGGVCRFLLLLSYILYKLRD